MGADKCDKPQREVAVSIIYDQSTSRILMVTRRKHPKIWILPQGGVEPGESSGQAAIRESWEEAGCPRHLDPPPKLLSLDLEPEASKRYNVYWHIHVIHTTEDAVNSTTDWPERGERDRAWFSVPDAITKICEWYIDEKPVASPDTMEDVGALAAKMEKKSAKRSLKGGAMETALKAFIEDQAGATRGGLAVKAS